jgi:hypothetical protein
MSSNDNIIISIEENESDIVENSINFDINNFLLDDTVNEDLRLSTIINYNEIYTVKELLLICDYYGFSKEIKANKLGKELLIQCLVDYELDIDNAVTVEKRKKMWFYMNELKNDKFMKKYVLW